MNHRPKKGEDYIGVTVVYLCHDGKGKWLLHKRGQNARDEQSRWDIGGGAIEFDASVEDTLKKEIQEEYGTDVIESEFLGFRDVHRMYNSKKTHWIALCFKVLVDPSKVKNGEPHKFDGIGWFTLDTLPHPLHSQFPAFLEQFKNRI